MKRVENSEENMHVDIENLETSMKQTEAYGTGKFNNQIKNK